MSALQLSAVVELQAGISASVFVDVDGNATTTSTVPWVLPSTTHSVDLSVETMDESYVLDVGDHDISFYAREAGTRLVAVGIQPHTACRWVPPQAEDGALQLDGERRDAAMLLVVQGYFAGGAHVRDQVH